MRLKLAEIKLAKSIWYR